MYKISCRAYNCNKIIIHIKKFKNRLQITAEKKNTFVPLVLKFQLPNF